MSALEVKVDPSSVGLDAGRLERIAAHFNRYLEDRRLPGWLVTVSRGGALAWVGRGGHRDRENDRPVTDDTIWRIYSMTKPVTAVVAMSLYEEGLFDLNHNVGRWIPELAEARVYVGGGPEAPETRPAAGPVRVAHLLSHTSGLTYGFQYRHPVDAIYRQKGYDFVWRSSSDLAGAVHDFCSAPLLFDPGTRFNYSVSLDVLGYLIERWTGQSLDAVFRERVLGPLGMTDTDWWCPEDKHDRLAELYLPGPDGAVAFPDWGRHARRWPRLLGAGGGLMSSARDYERFMAMLLNGGELEGRRIISRPTLALMTANHLSAGGDLATLAEDGYADLDGAGMGFGFGGAVVTNPAANLTSFSAGTYLWGGAASTYFWVDPREQLSAAFYTQLMPPSTYPLRRELQQLVYGALAD
jgi:CubicO group peptidase (beta-lactamase class C family)